jgi:hypothetical protein
MLRAGIISVALLHLRANAEPLGLGKRAVSLFADARKNEFFPPVQRDAIRPVPRAKINRFALDPNQHYNLRYPGP